MIRGGTMFTLKPLPYDYDALEPFIDKETMILHHDKHHQAYVDKLNAALEGHEELKKKQVAELLKDLNAIPENIRTAVKNQGGGVWNHDFFWSIMKKGTSPKGEILEEINKKFGSVEKFYEEFSKAAVNLFGSGWAWLVTENRELKIITTSNQDCPLSAGQIPLLTIDVWEHAYYLKYRNRRADYVKAFFNVINWDKVNELFVKTRT